VASVITVSGDIVGDVLIVVGMVVVEIFLLTRIIPRSGPPATLALMVIGTSELLGSAGLLMALVGAFFQSNLTTYTVVLFMFNFMMLTPPGLWVIAVIIYHDRRIDTTSWFWPVAIVTLATTAEVLMGLLFTVVSGSTPTIPVVLAGTLNSAWYFWSMGAAMVALLVWVRFEPIVRYPLLGLAGSAAVAPWVVVDPVAGALLMAGVIAAPVHPAGDADAASRGALGRRSVPRHDRGRFRGRRRRRIHSLGDPLRFDHERGHGGGVSGARAGRSPPRVAAAGGTRPGGRSPREGRRRGGNPRSSVPRGVAPRGSRCSRGILINASPSVIAWRVRDGHRRPAARPGLPHDSTSTPTPS
jgi:hypothetical protein